MSSTISMIKSKLPSFRSDKSAEEKAANSAASPTVDDTLDGESTVDSTKRPPDDAMDPIPNDGEHAHAETSPSQNGTPKEDGKGKGPSTEAIEKSIPEVPSQLDLVFVVDNTGSMSSYISAVQTNVHKIVTEVAASEKCEVQFGLVAYRDHPPQERTYVTRVFPFTNDLAIVRTNVNAMSASGGGDGPEAVCCGLHEALHLKWRPNAAKVVVLIADAPPHGLGESGDGFPNGCVDGHDPLATARQMLEAGITVYTVSCEPALSQYIYARDFMVAVADMTGGQAIALSSAQLLVDVILGGAREELDLERLMNNMHVHISAAQQQVSAERVTSGRTAAPSESDSAAEQEEYAQAVHRSVADSLRTAGVRTKQLVRDGTMSAPRAATMSKAGGLSEWRVTATSLAPPPPPAQAVRSGCCVGGSAPMPRGGLAAMVPQSWGRSRSAAAPSAAPAASSSVAALCRDEEAEERCSESALYATADDAHSGSNKSSTVVMMKEDAISYDQVARLYKKSLARKR